MGVWMFAGVRVNVCVRMRIGLNINVRMFVGVRVFAGVRVNVCVRMRIGVRFEYWCSDVCRCLDISGVRMNISFGCLQVFQMNISVRIFEGVRMLTCD